MSNSVYISPGLWVIIYLILSVYAKWVISWGGAIILEKWSSSWNWLGYFHESDESTESQIKFATKLFWGFFTILFVVGMFVPEVRKI